MKHVLPTLRKPTNPRDAMDDDVTDDDVVSGDLPCICSIQNVSINKASNRKKTKNLLLYFTQGAPKWTALRYYQTALCSPTKFILKIFDRLALV